MCLAAPRKPVAKAPACQPKWTRTRASRKPGARSPIPTAALAAPQAPQAPQELVSAGPDRAEALQAAARAKAVMRHWEVEGKRRPRVEAQGKPRLALAAKAARLDKLQLAQQGNPRLGAQDRFQAAPEGKLRVDQQDRFQAAPEGKPRVDRDRARRVWEDRSPAEPQVKGRAEVQARAELRSLARCWSPRTPNRVPATFRPFHRRRPSCPSTRGTFSSLGCALPR